MATDKQIAANRENAKSGGVRTEDGKEVVRWNALKHGLLAKEVVIDAGDGLESRQEFDSLLLEFRERLQPEGILEEVLVEKIVASYWRYRRLIRCEVGLIRYKLDSYQDKYYDPDEHQFDDKWKTHKAIEKEIASLRMYLDIFTDSQDTEGKWINPRHIEQQGYNIDLDSYYYDLASNSDKIPWQESFGSSREVNSTAIYDWLLKNGWTVQAIKNNFAESVRIKIRSHPKTLRRVMRAQAK